MATTSHSRDRTTASMQIPLTDLESAPPSFQRPDQYASWNGSSHTSASDVTESNGLAPKPAATDWDWIDYSEDVFSNMMIALVPSFLQKHVGGVAPEPAKLHAIAALDGLRGWACLLVFNFHLLFTYTWQVSIGWGFAGGNFGIHQLPFLHLFISGHIMVAIFFVLSGYVLSYKPLKTIRGHSFEQTFTVLASSTFRRALRLYIPPFVGLASVFVAVRMGLYNYSWVVIREGHTILGTNEEHPPVFRTASDQFWDLYSTVARLINVFDYNLFYNNYNPHLWTIPVELRCSIILFLTILATSRLKTVFRMSLVANLMWFSSRYGRWDVILFLAGMLMAEIDLINGTWERPVIPAANAGDDKIHLTHGGRIMVNISRRTVWIIVFVLGLYFGSSPNLGFKWTPGYMWLWHYTPSTYGEPHRFPQAIGAALIVFSINHSPDIQKLFTAPLSQYLGKISFAFYIVHGPILHALGYALMPNIWYYTGKESNFQFCFGLLIGYCILLPICICVGDFFWRYVDIPSVKFARWVESYVTVGKTTSEPKPSG
ncbi:hypothetical protein N7492_005635 [Penicillium capsulatum]|uniref:Acyltransferase 3 domain-containing protein n=1 Tax=Penicillium capsulatum TaxID=69766 RepID=A0A9W9IG48_9EURO|nr:hypothetical protein N7492_005635 [Penicillium capsulatum]KAJ6135267.1 hypothetical protein N7512_000427 [Penicillium capsulatum]